jgi:mediator of RNA polymerase II transcription subunit 12
MVDKRTFLSWVIHQLASSNLGQASFVVCIAENYIDDIVSSRPFAYHLAVAVIDRLVEVGQ